jgi:hypothetical protein
VWISELGGSGPNEAARENAYTIIKEGLLARHFEENGRSQVLFLFPGVSLTRRMTPQRLQDAIDNNYDNQHGRSWVENCWVPRNLLKRWCAWHHLPESPPRFQPSQEIRTPVSPEGAKRSPESPMPAPTLVPEPASKLVVDAVDQPEVPSGIAGEVSIPIAQDGREQRSLLAHEDFPTASGECNTQSDKGGRPPAVDWEALKEPLAREINHHGYPDPRNAPGWRRTKDVADWAQTQLRKEAENVSRRTIENNIRRLLQEHKASSTKPDSR